MSWIISCAHARIGMLNLVLSLRAAMADCYSFFHGATSSKWNLDFDEYVRYPRH